MDAPTSRQVVAMNVVFSRRDRITHEARQTNANGGVTWCGVTFYWDEAVRATEGAECDCMACVARPEIAIAFSGYQKPGIGVVNAGALAKLEFLTDDKEPT